MSVGKPLRLALALAVSAGLLWLLLRGVETARLLETLSTASGLWLVGGLLALASGYALRIRRWQAMLRQENPTILWRQCAGPLLAGFAMNNVLPFRAGDVLRCVGFGAQLNVSGGSATASLFVERLLDALILLGALAAALLIFGVDGQRFFAFGGTVLALIALVAMLLLLFPRLLAPVLSGFARGFGRVLPRFAGPLDTEAGRALQLLEGTARGRTLAPLVGWSMLVWLAEGLVFYCIARSLPALETPLGAWLALPVATLATLLPGTPGHLGTFDFFAAEAMQVAGAAALSATAFALLVHATLWLPVTLAGALWLWGRRG